MTSYLNPIYDTDVELGTLNFLENLCPSFSEIKNIIDSDMKKRKVTIHEGNQIKLWKPKPINKNKIIKGFMQSGKTSVMITMSLYYLLKYRMSTFIIIQNSLDACEQITNRIQNTLGKYFKLLGENKELNNLFGCKRNRDIDEDELFDSIIGKSPNIYVTLNNSSDTKIVIKNLENINIDRFVLIIDESDFNDSGITGNTQEHLQVLKLLSNIIWNVTATPMCSLMKEDIESGSVFVMKKPEHYKDLPTIDFIDLKEKINFGRGIVDPFIKDPNMKEYLTKFSKSEPHYCSFWKQYHPVYSLVRFGNAVQPQLKLAAFTDKNFGNKVVSITYNGGSYGITLRGACLPTKQLYIDDHTISIYRRKVHIFYGCHIGKIISYLQKLGVEKVPRIVIFSGKMADRGITFSASNYDECIKKKKILWHLTEMYFICSKTTSQPNVLQSVGRLCGIYKDNIPLTLYTNYTEDIIKAYHVQEELIVRSKNASLSQAMNLMKNLIVEQPISKEKCCKRKITNNVIQCKLNKVLDDSHQGGWDWSNREIKKSIIVSSSINKEIFDCILVSGKMTKKCQEFFDYIYLNVNKNNLVGSWLKASRFYRDNANDQQRCHNIYKKKTYTSIPFENVKYILLRKEKNTSNYEIKINL